MILTTTTGGHIQTGIYFHDPYASSGSTIMLILRHINYVFLALDSTTNKVNLLGSQLVRPFILLNRRECLCCGYEIIPGQHFTVPL